MLEVVLKLVLAIICGGVIGLERDKKKRGVGKRTYMTVCLSTTVIMIIAMEIFKDTHSGDMSRMAAAAIQGIGFLGAGLIMQKEDHLEGITTAAILWGTAIIGLAIGYGLYYAGIMLTLAFIFVGDVLVKIMNKKSKNKG